MDLQSFIAQWQDHHATLLVHTSGSTGQPKPLLVEKRRMEASARITCQFLGLQSGDTALLCLPLDYIAGKMMVVRALTNDLRLISVPPSSHPLATVTEPITFAAMVPLQVYHSLQVPQESDRLKAIRHLIIGGGAIDQKLETALQSFPYAVWSTYGMTETLSHIALRRLNGPARSDWYTPFDGVKVSLSGEGCLVIDAPAVHDGILVTHDMAEIDGCRFRILGRKDNVVCSGGIKIQIEEVEQQLHHHTEIPLLVTKVPDERLGEQLVLLTESTDVQTLQKLCQQVLPHYWQPRRFFSVAHIPLTETGKPARQEAARLATQLVALLP